MIPHGEETTVVWTKECKDAHSVAAPLLEQGDKVAARMAFLESYRKLTADARANHTPVSWEISLGWDAKGREGPLLAAVAQGRLPLERVTQFLPMPEAREVKALEAPRAPSEVARNAIAEMRKNFGMPPKRIPGCDDDQEAARG